MNVAEWHDRPVAEQQPAYDEILPAVDSARVPDPPNELDVPSVSIRNRVHSPSHGLFLYSIDTSRSPRLVTPFTISVLGFEKSPETEVLPICSIDLRKEPAASSIFYDSSRRPPDTPDRDLR